MKLVLFLLDRSRRVVAIAVLAAILSGSANATLLGLLNGALNTTGPRPLGLAWAFFGLAIVAFLLRLLSEILLIRLGQQTIFELRLELCRRILGVSLRRLERLGSHRTLSTLTEDVPTITGSITLLPILSFNLAIVVTCLVYLASLSMMVFGALLVFLAVGIAAYQLPVIQANKLFEKVRSTNDALYGHFRALTHGLKELKAHRRRRRAFLDEALDGTAAEYREQSIRGYSIYAAASGAGQLIALYVLGLLIFVLPALVPVASSVLVGYVLVLLYMLTPLQETMNSLPALNRATVSLRRIEGLGLDLEEGQETVGREAPTTWELLELEGVTHSYRREGEEHDFVLGPIDLRIEPGELVFLVGGNGSGKTTLAKVIAGLYPAESGELRLDGETMTEERLDDFRQLFSIVFSDFFLFEEFLGLERPDLDEQARRYLERLQLDHKVTIEKGGLSTTELSQGQRKRLALLTAFLEDRPIYLFDEWAADQDPTFKAVFYEAILPELQRRGKAVIVISHDDAYFHVADRVLTLDYGRLCETSTASAVEP